MLSESELTVWMQMEDKSDHILVIEAGKSHSRYLRDLWLYRELFLILAWRDIIVRYKQTIIGIAWSIIRPLLGMIVFTVVFGKLAKLPSEGVPYPLMVYAGMLMWQFFSSTVSSGSESLLGNSNLISTVYFPRLIIPSTSMTVSLTDFLISAVVFIPLFFWYGTIPSWKIVFLPCFILLTAILSLGVTYFISSLNVKYRDFRYVIPFALQVYFPGRLHHRDRAGALAASLLSESVGRNHRRRSLVAVRNPAESFFSAHIHRDFPVFPPVRLLHVPPHGTRIRRLYLKMRNEE